MDTNPRKLNYVLRSQRMNRGWSQQRVAEQLDTTEDMVSKWERGISKPSPFYRERLCNLFNMSAKELGLLETPDAPGEPNKPALQLAMIDQAMTSRLDYTESIINLSWEAWYASRPRQAANEITRLLPGLERMMHKPYLSPYRLRITELVIRSHALLGTICMDALQNDSALFHYMEAHKYAEEIRDTDLTATYLALIGDVLRRQNKKLDAIQRMETARDQAINSAQATRGHVLQLLAYTYGDTGNEAAFERTIQEATDLLAFTGEGRDAAKKEFIPFEIYEIRGKANRDLGKPLQAIFYLDAAEKSLGRAEHVTPRFHALLDISRGQAYCDAGDLATGVDLASRGFLLAYQCHSPRQMNRVRKLVKKLEGADSPHKHERQVAQLKELVHETYAEMDLEK